MAFHGALRHLYDTANEPHERNEQTLINKFFSGLENQKVAEAVLLRVAEHGNPATYAVALEMALEINSQMELLAFDRKQRAMTQQLTDKL